MKWNILTFLATRLNLPETACSLNPAPFFYAFFFTSWKRTNQHSAQETSSLPKIGRLCRTRLEFLCVFEEEKDNGNDAAAMANHSKCSANHSAIGLFKMIKSQFDKKKKMYIFKNLYFLNWCKLFLSNARIMNRKVESL